MSRRKSPLSGQYSLPSLYGELQQDYKAAKVTRFQRTRTGLPAMGAGADYHYRSEHEFYKTVEIARDIERNDTVIRQGLRRLVANIVQDGFAPDANTGDQELDQDLQARWREWAADRNAVTTSQELSFCQVERLALYQTLVDGDICALLTRLGALEMLEAHRLRTPRTTKNVVLGVLLDQNRRRLQYWFTRESLDAVRSGSTLRVGDMRRIATRDSDGNRQVLHLYNPSRISQTRGVTALQPIVDTTSMLDDIQFARLVQQQAVSAWCILREREMGFKSTRGDTTGTGNFELPDTLDGTLTGIAAGMEVVAPPGERVTGFSPNVPNPSFFEHVGLILNLIAVNLDMPVAMLMLDPSHTNFSGWRGAMDQAKIVFRTWQQWFASVFHREVYQWKLRQWISADRALAKIADRQDIDIFSHRWSFPRWPYIEPLKDASADLLRDRNAQTSKRRLHAERGVDWADLAREIVDDNAYAIRLAKDSAASLNSDYPDSEPVTWRELISLPTPDGVQISMQPQLEGAEHNAPAENAE